MAAPKYFGTYLVENKIITAEQLVQALMAQAAELPTTMQVIYDSRLLSASDWLRVLEHQMGNKSEFKASCTTLGLWTEEMENALQAALNVKRTPLGQVLLKIQATDLVTLTKALDEFLTTVKAPAQSASVPAAASKPELKFEFHQLDDALVGDFSDFFSPGKLDDILTKMAHVGRADDSSIIKNALSDVTSDAHVLKGVAVCLRMPVTIYLLEAIESLITRAGQHSDKAALIRDIGRCGQIMESIKIVRESVIKDRSEQNFWNEFGAQVQKLVDRPSET